MTKQNMRKCVTALMVILLGVGIYFILPEKSFIVISDNVDNVQIRILVSAFISAALSSIIVHNINPKNFFNPRESSGIVVIILIVAIFLCVIF